MTTHTYGLGEGSIYLYTYSISDQNKEYFHAEHVLQINPQVHLETKCMRKDVGIS